ncbi:PEP-CTERM sorting domain-containing protein [Prosthecobacter sp. SYSU 5D2]|uniref:PEP-CTERM sorting domain-containing protein n=1 Tax=Prosthecobacter sp. SYSU 5D2 TaxID=3134134 RepID=UPI0031FE56A0
MNCSPLACCRRTFSFSAALCLATLVSTAGAQSVWTGAADNSWSNAGNWNGGLPSTISGSPSDVTFATNDANGDTLTLDSLFYLNRLVAGPLNYGVTEKVLAATGAEGSRLVFQKLGDVLPTINVTHLANTEVSSGNLTRDLAFRTDIEIADDLTLTRTGGTGSVSSGNQRLYRTIFYGVISGSGKLTINSNSSSNSTRIWFDNHNTFTGDVDMQRGYLFQNYADSLGAADKTISFGSVSSVTWDLSSSNINATLGATIPYDLVTPSPAGSNVLINGGSVSRQLLFTGDITGSASHTATQRSVHLIAQSNQQMVFAGENMTFGGQVFARYGSEVAIAAANAEGKAWENVKNILLGQEITTSVSTTTNNSSLVLRGGFTLDAPVEVTKRTTGSSGRDKVSLGQINHQGSAYQAVFNGRVNVLESDYRSLNLISESGGSATFNGAVTVAGEQGLLVNDIVNATTSGGTLNYYEAAPLGTVIFSSTSRLGEATTGTGSAGSVDVMRGALLVNTSTFYAGVNVLNTAQLGGTGSITGNVVVSEGGRLQPGAGLTSPAFASSLGSLTLTGNLSLTGAASLVLQVGGATFNVGSTEVEDIPSIYASSLALVGDHDYLDITGSLTANTPGSIQFSPVGDFQPTWGDAFHLLDFGSLLTGVYTTREVLDLPDLSLINPDWMWNTDLFVSHGLLVVVPEPSRMSFLLLALVGAVTRRRR